MEDYWWFWKRHCPPGVDEGIYKDTLRIKDALRYNDGVRMSCFNEKEANLIKGLLTEEERARTSSTWGRFR